MLKFNSLHLKKCVYFNDATLRLDTGDILVVNGKNLKSREKHQTNGSGKSLFFSYLPNIVFASHPLAIRANSKKDMYTAGTNGKATLTFSSGDSSYKITQNGGASSVGYSIKKDGQDQKIRTTPLSEKYIKSVFPLTEAEFYTTVYLNSQRDFVFQRGKSEARLKFFTEFFRLDYYDQMKASFLEELKKVKRVEIEVSTYEGQRLRLVEEIKEIETDSESDTESLDSLTQKLEEKKSLRKKLSARIDRLTKEKSFLDLQKQLLTSIGDVPRPTKEKTKSLAKTIEHIESQIYLLEAIKTNTLAKKNHETKANLAKEELKGLCTSLDVSLEQVKEFDPDSKIVEKFNAAVSKQNAQKKNKEQKEKLSTELAECKKNLDSVLPKAELLQKIAESEQQITTYKKLKEHLEEDTCPICGSVVDLDTQKEKAKLAQKLLKNLTAQHQYHDIKHQLGLVEFDREAYEEQKETVLRLQLEFDQYKKLAKNYKKLIGLISSYQSFCRDRDLLEKQLQVQNSKVDAAAKTDNLEKYRKQYAMQENAKKLYSQLDTLLKKCEAEGVDITNLDANECGAKLAEYTKKHSKIEGDVDKISSKLNRVTVKREKLKLLENKLKEANAKIEELNFIVADKQLIENLIKVYSNKGIKIQRINAICRILERNLNHFKSLLFDENFKFKIQLEENTFDVIVDRNDGIVSDVRHLSGSEGRRFNLLLLISLLPLTPANRRSNLVILDEMESNASPTSIGLFCDRFIPELHKLVPNIIVVSPLDLRIENSKQVLVTKDKDGSRIEFINQLQG